MSVLLILQIAAAVTFAGYSRLCFTGQTPYHVFFWNEALLSPWVSGWAGMSWDTYATSPSVGRFIDHFTIGMGVFFALCAVAAIGISRFPKTAIALLYMGSIQLLIWAVLNGIDKIFFFVQFAEYALQWSIPLFGIFAYRQLTRDSTKQPQYLIFLRAAAAVTFAAHGLYALGIFPRPGYFIQMTMSILSVQEAGAIHFLTAAGLLDLMAAVWVLLSIRKLQMAALWYMLIWGFLTTAARWVAHVYFDLPWWPETFLAWTPEVLMRFSHFLGPLAALHVIRSGGHHHEGISNSLPAGDENCSTQR